jgi:hypothetical protein
MATTDASNELRRMFDASTALPLTTNFANEPTDLRYHRYFDEETETNREIFVPPGKEQEILDLDANEEWDKLHEFPPFSDGPRPDIMRPNFVGFPQADGTLKELYIPDDEAKLARMYELMRVEDYKTLEEEFEPWSKYDELLVLIS